MRVARCSFSRSLGCFVGVCLIAAGVPPARGQPADPTELKLVPRSLSLEVDDPDAYVKKAANDIVNEEVLRDERFNALLVLSYKELQEAVARFNTTNYGHAILFLKGGNALRYYYETKIFPHFNSTSNAYMANECSDLFQQSDIDYAVNTRWSSEGPDPRSLTISMNEPRLVARDFWLRDPTSNNEYGYQILNSLVIEGMDKLRRTLLTTELKILFQQPGQVQFVPTDSKVLRELNQNFRKDPSGAFLQKWADFIAAGVVWQSVALPNEPIFLSRQLQEFEGRRATQIVFPHEELLSLEDADELDKYNDLRNIALPDKVILEGPTPQLLYAYQRNHHISSVYLTSNYAETWPSDPTIDPANYTKFALHRLKLALPLRFVMNQTDNSTKPFKKLLGKSISAGNGQVANVLVVGGELVDVGVDHPSAALLGHEPLKPEDLAQMPVRVGKDTFNIPIAGSDWLTHDLKEAIFDIVGMPWKKKKYEKRVGRFMCIIRPELEKAGALVGVSNYLACVEQAQPGQVQQCDTQFPTYQLSQSPHIIDFFVGADPKNPYKDTTKRHSVRRVMANLPAEERAKAIEFLNLLRKYLQ